MKATFRDKIITHMTKQKKKKRQQLLYFHFVNFESVVSIPLNSICPTKVIKLQNTDPNFIMSTETSIRATITYTH